LSVRRRIERGESHAEVTRFVVVRGLIIAALDPLWMHWVFEGPGGPFSLNVLYAIGTSFIALAFLRRLPARALGVAGFMLALAIEPLGALLGHAEGWSGALVHLLVVPGDVLGPSLSTFYPTLPWLAIMLMGWGAADLWSSAPARFPRRLVVAGV